MIKLPDILDKVLDSLIWQGVTSFRTGGAVGFDTVAALAVIEKKKDHPEIKLELKLPCKDQNSGWSDMDNRVYDYIISHADDVSYTCEAYRKGCMHERNRSLVDGADFCVAFCASEKGGSAYTLNYARKKQLNIINVYNIAKICSN